MDLAKRKGLYSVVTIGHDGVRTETEQYKDEQVARAIYNKFLRHYKVVLFCTVKPTVTGGSIDPDLY